MSRLKFHGQSHRYYLDGRRVSGVTTLLGGLPKPALVGWAARAVAEHVADNPEQVEHLRGMGRAPMIAALKEVPWQSRDEAATRGSIVHTITQQVAEGGEVEVPADVAGYVEAAIGWLDAVGAEVLWCERPVWHDEHDWAGTPDMVARLHTGPHAGRTALVDWKTGRSGVWPESALQVAAYRHAQWMQADGKDEPMTPTDVGIVVHLGDGTATAYTARSDEHAYTRFRYVALVHRLAQDMRYHREDWLTETTEEEETP